MHAPLKRWTLWFGILALGAGSVPSACEAGPFLDWLFHRRPNYVPVGAPVVTPAPPRTVAPGALSACGVPATGLPATTLPAATLPATALPATTAPALSMPPPPATVTNYAPAGYPTAGYPTAGYPTAGYPTAGYPTAGYPLTSYYGSPSPTPGSVVAGYAPLNASAGVTAGYYGGTTAYQNAWVPVPVTVYRPVATVDPATGSSQTAMQACVTYQYQLRRVPQTTFRPSLFGGWNRPVLAPVTVPYTAPAAPPVTTYAAPSWPSAPAPAAAPAPGNCPLPDSSYTAPYSASPLDTATPPYVPSQDAGNGYPAAPLNGAPLDGGASGATGEPADQRPRLNANPGGAAPIPSSAHWSRPAEPRFHARPADPTPAASDTSPQVAPPSYQLRPIPDPDRPESKLRSITPPSLLDPHDRTVSHSAERAQPVSWFEPAAAAPPPPTTARPRAVQPQVIGDEGWSSTAR